MPPLSQQDYCKFLSEILRKNIIIFGSTISLVKAKSIDGISISEQGDVTSMVGNPQDITRVFIEKFMELSPQVTKKMLESLLANYPDISLSSLGISLAATPIPATQPPASPSETLASQQSTNQQ